MSTPETLPPKLYRILKPNEIIEEGDECFGGGQWTKCTTSIGYTTQNNDVPIRREDNTLRTRLAKVEKELAQENVIGKLLSDIIEAQGKTIESQQKANAELVKDKERLLNVLEHCALDPDKQPPEQYKVARNVTKEYRQAIDAAISAKDKTFWQDAVNKAGGTQ